MGLCSIGHSGSWGGLLVTVGAVVLEGQTRLRQSWRGSGVFCGAGLGEVDKGIRVAILRILSRARRSSVSTFANFLWWLAAHNSTFP